MNAALSYFLTVTGISEPVNLLFCFFEAGHSAASKPKKPKHFQVIILL